MPTSKKKEVKEGDSVEVIGNKYGFKGRKGRVTSIAYGRGAKQEASIKGRGRGLEFLVPVDQLSLLTPKKKGVIAVTGGNGSSQIGKEGGGNYFPKKQGKKECICSDPFYFTDCEKHMPNLEIPKLRKVENKYIFEECKHSTFFEGNSGECLLCEKMNEGKPQVPWLYVLLTLLILAALISNVTMK